jgi:hypothetical protein
LFESDKGNTKFGKAQTRKSLYSQTYMEDLGMDKIGIIGAGNMGSSSGLSR